MSHITSQQLDHLAKLCRIQLSSEDKQKLLPQLEQIITFVGQLEEVDVSDIVALEDQDDSVHLVVREWVDEAWLTEKLLASPGHDIIDNSIAITDKLSEY